MSGKISDIPPDDGSAGTPDDVPPGALCPGARFATYALEELVGVGSTASIYRARDSRLLRQVAIKVWTSGAPAGADGLARFLHEARMAAAVRHPNVVSIFDVGVHDGAPYIVMELLDGEDLDERLRASRVLPEAAVLDLALPLVAGLMAVHDAGVVHRDLKPSNIFLSRGPNGDVRPTLLDFGVSKHSRDSLRLTTLGRQRWAAMPLYTSPEVLLGGEATFLSDQYSLGVLLYECVTGMNPFRADSPRDSIDLIVAGQYLPASAHGHRASRALAKVIERAMSPEPEERFADLRELGRALAAVAGRRARATWSSAFGAELVASPMPTPMARRTPLASRAARRGRFAAWALGAAVAGWSIAGVLSAWFLTGTPRLVERSTIAPALSPADARVPAPPDPSVASAGASIGAPAPAAEQGLSGERVALAHHTLEPSPPHFPLPSAVGAGSGGDGEPGAGRQGERAAPAPSEPPSEPVAEEPALAAPNEPAPGAPIEPGGVAPAEAVGPAPHEPGVLLPGEPGAAGEVPAMSTDGSLIPPPGEGGAPPSAGVAPPDQERGTNGALIFD